LKRAFSKLRNQVIDGRAVVATSGGVDSTTVAVLGYRALGRRLAAVFLDNGLMREGEPEDVTSLLRETGMDVDLFDVSGDFFDALKGVVDPELKRKAFRDTFYLTLSRILKEMNAKYLLQGTIAADIVETSQGVKTQHNVLDQIGINPLHKYGFIVVEPLSTLYKDQVRLVTKSLSLSKKSVDRRPFPGPALAIRVLGEVTRQRVDLIRKVTKIVEEEMENVRCFQALAVLMNDQATGLSKVAGRRYGEIVVVRVVDSVDAISAKSTHVPCRILEKISQRITANQPSITRVLYELTGKPPATIEFE
jgi:GMP synthase (glutamine-hydrolysing)